MVLILAKIAKNAMGVFMAMASTFVFCISDMSEKVTQRPLEWPLFELDSTLQCSYLQIDPVKNARAFTRGVRLLEFIPALT